MLGRPRSPLPAAASDQLRRADLKSFDAHRYYRERAAGLRLAGTGVSFSDQELGPALRDGRIWGRGQEEGERETWTQKQVS